ncbi:MAG: hypothetical protein UC390_00700, partial [Peptococcaceae bacterium]|nr:hypothetical protein [Peptococcaceae bacterium]
STPLVIQYIILSNKWGAVHRRPLFLFLQKPCSLCAAGFFFVLRQGVMVMMALSLQKMLDVKKLHRV